VKVVYVAGPYSAPSHVERELNIVQARTVGAAIVRLGAVPFIPHSNTAHFDDVASPEFFYAAGLEFLHRSDAVFMGPFWEKSSGSLLELREAGRVGIPVFYTLQELKAWLDEFEHRCKKFEPQQTREA